MVPLNVFDADPGDPDLLERIAIHLERGGLLAHPTETVYGLGAAPTAEGVEGIREMKGRDGERPFLVLLPYPSGPDRDRFDPEEEWGLDWPESARALARACWPGPLTLVLRDGEERFPLGIRSAEGGVAVRISSHPFVLALLDHWKRPFISTSANRPGQPPATTREELLHAVEGRPGLHRFWFANAGSLPTSLPSTVVECMGSPPRILRAGAIPTDELTRILPELIDVD